MKYIIHVLRLFNLEPRAVALLSGGLDSAIAAKIILDQGIEVFGLNFTSPFCTCNRDSSRNGCNVLEFSRKLGIPLKIMAKGDDYLRIVQSPRFGYGKNLNPCIDCRIYILKRVKQFADKINASFLITGEVLGQRPKSQTLRAMKLIEENSGLKGLIVRPLSAKLLEPTLPEKLNLINREKMLKISGRRRVVHLELGRRFNLIENYCAGGGCLLTNKDFSARLRDYFRYCTRPTMKDMIYLKFGRHFRFKDTKIISGRNERENKLIESWLGKSRVILELKGIKGPTTIVFSPKDQIELDFAAQVTIRYSDSTCLEHEVLVKDVTGRFKDFRISRDPGVDLDRYRISAR
ncbi:MAG: hypothetical protein ACTSXU_00010 [Promethearchaeota archaeon]